MNYLTVDFNYPIDPILELLSTCDSRTTQAITWKKLFLLRTVLGTKYKITSVLYFQLMPGFVGVIHKDGDLNFGGQTPQFALNLPLQNCNETVMHWFTQKPDTPSSILPGITHESGRIPFLQAENAVRVDTATINKPTLVQIEKWHSVDNHSDLISRFISVRFAPDVTMKDVI